MPKINTIVDGIRDALYTTVGSAWTGLTGIYRGSPRIVVQPPFAVIYINEVRQEWATLTTVHMPLEFTIVGVFKYPAATTAPDDEKLTKADSLIDLLEAGVTYGTYGMIPTISRVGFEDSEDIEDAYEVHVTLSVLASSTYSS
jgi:hypothetical protein